MSYDLFFLKQKDQSSLAESELKKFLLSRPNYKIDDTQAWYENEETGCYFSFDFGGSDPETEIIDEEYLPPDDGLVDAGISFNINYFRPHTFGLEAAPELAALVKHFDLRIDDPQNEGMGRGLFTDEGFLKGWNAGNRFGYSAFLRQVEEGEVSISPYQQMTMPANQLELLWRWNYNRNQLQQTINVDAYVSLVRLFEIDGQPKSIVVWGDGISEAFPKVDYIMLVRDKFAPRKLLRKKKDTCLIKFKDIEPILHFARQVSAPVPYFLFDYQLPPKEVTSLIRAQQPFDGQLNPVSWDQVLTEEIFHEAQSCSG